MSDEELSTYVNIVMRRVTDIEAIADQQDLDFST